MQNARAVMSAIADNIEKVIVGKRQIIELALTAVVSGGHVLIEDVPGVGKTSLVSSFARSINCSYKRIQFTPDVMPSDITGFSMYNPKTGEFEYRPGAILHQFVQADEINRASSKTQSALLEAMEERQVTVDGSTYKTPAPFIVFATQNPQECVGTFQLPEAQLDRFSMCLSMGYPMAEQEIELVLNRKSEHPVDLLQAVASGSDLEQLKQMAAQVFISEEVAAYIVTLTTATRSHPDIKLGASPRASLHLCRAAKAWAMHSGRNYMLPDDVQRMLLPVLRHRVFLGRNAKLRGLKPDDVLMQIMSAVRAPIVS